MKQRVNGHRFSNYYAWDNVKNQSYDYEKHGLLKHILSHKIVETENETLKLLLNFYETSLIFLMKYVDILKNFKNIHWKNR